MVIQLDNLWRVKLLFVLLLPTTFSARSEDSGSDGQERTLTDLIALVESWGYRVEPHKVTTKDNYILTVFHVLPKDEEKKKSPVLIQHGLVSCGAVFLANRQGLAYFLHENGYDVWVGNARGTQFSQTHKYYKTNSAEFWNFSFHEMGINDIPAVLQYIKAESGRPKVHYVGHSMGTTMFLVMATEMPELLEIVDTVTLLAPVAVPRHMSPFSSSLTWSLAHFATRTLPHVGFHWHTQQKWMGEFLYKTCEDNSWMGRLCRSLTGRKQNTDFQKIHYQLKTTNSGKDKPKKYSSNPQEKEKIEEKEKFEEKYKIEDTEITDEYSSVEITRTKVDSSAFDYRNAHQAIQYFYDGTSWKTHRHFLQIIKAGKFQWFDYEKDHRLEYSGSPNPRLYPIHRITKRIYLLSGGLDVIAQPEDIVWLHKRLKNSWLIERGFEDFDHEAFNHGMGVPILLNAVDCIIKASEQGVDPDLPKTESVGEEVEEVEQVEQMEQVEQVEQPPKPKRESKTFFTKWFYSNHKDKSEKS